MKSYKEAVILKNEEISKNIFLMRLKVKMDVKPGQFFMLRSDTFRQDPLLSRPFSVSDCDIETISFLYQVKGKATDIIANLKEGALLKLLGPLGNGFNVDYPNEKSIALVSGGIGIAPLLYLAKSLKRKFDLYAGFRNEKYFINNFSNYASNIHTVSERDDKMFVTQLLKNKKYDIIYACGPNIMLKNLYKQTPKCTDIYISMEAHMACGIGACLGCTVGSSKGEFLRVCKDGPVFEAKEIFNES